MLNDVIFTVNGIFEGIRVVSVSRYRENLKKNRENIVFN